MVNTNPNNPAENKEIHESQKKAEKVDRDKDLVNKIGGSVDAKVTKVEFGTVVGAESAEDSESSEGYGEGENKKKGDGDVKKGAKKDDDDAASIRASIASGARAVTASVMTRVVKIAIHNEISTVQKEIHKLSSDAIGNAFELSEALKKLKKLKFILANLVHMAADAIKSIYDRIKKGDKVIDMKLVDL